MKGRTRWMVKKGGSRDKGSISAYKCFVRVIKESVRVMNEGVRVINEGG